MDTVQFLKKNRKIFLDSMIFIYLFEGYHEHQKDLKYLFTAIEEGKNLAFTSLITLSEVLVKPYKLQAFSLIDEYLRFFNEFPHLHLLTFSQETALQTAKIRALSRFKTPDAIQIATALEEKTQGFITSDRQLVFEGIDFLYF